MEYSPTELQGFALEIFRKRYALHDQETWLEACHRVAGHVASAEVGENISKWKTIFEANLSSQLFCPGGRIWYGSGRPRGQLLNCFVLPTSDSREGWGDTVKEMIIISGTGGGVGVNFSPIRPRGTPIIGTGGTATGATSLMEIVNAAAGVIKAGGGRRGALLLGLNLNHGDIIEFLDKKLNLNELENSNVSVFFNENPEDFFKLIKEDKDFELVFRGKVIGKIKARILWEKIISNALKAGEPGLLNGYLANKLSNTWYINPLVSTNPCGELFMSKYESCCLGSIVLPRFIQTNNEMDWNKLSEVVRNSVRFLDDVLTINNYPLSEIAETCKNMRRIGLGIMGLHDMLLRKGLKYTSDVGLEFVDKVLSFIKNTAYQTSCELAEEKGSFPFFDADKFSKSGFIKTLKPSIRSLIREKGIRNCALLTIAPTGTTSLICNTTSGIEPMFAAAAIRKYRDGDELRQEIVVHPLFKEHILKGKGTRHFQGSYDIKIQDHLEMQRLCQRHVDNSISKTVNLSPGTTVETLSDLYMEYFPELKGITVYPINSREDQPLTPLSLEEAIKVAKEDKGINFLIEEKCKSGSCDI